MIFRIRNKMWGLEHSNRPHVPKIKIDRVGVWNERNL